MSIEHEKLGPHARRWGLRSLVMIAAAALILGLFLGKGFGVRQEAPQLNLFGAQKMQVAATPST
jgi:hypothetical protein